MEMLEKSASDQIGWNVIDNAIVNYCIVSGFYKKQSDGNSSFALHLLGCSIFRMSPSNCSIIHSLIRLLTWFLSKLRASSGADGVFYS